MSESLKDNVSKQIIAAMKAKDKIRLQALRYLKKLFIENETAKKKVDEMEIVISYAKKMKDSMEMYPEGSEQRADLEAEVKVLSEFLPQQLTKEEVQSLIDEAKAAQDNPNMGSLMGALSAKTKGKFDGKELSQMVQAALK
ncbi:GatB/YqeY domain-containing protein [Halobacteriovorax sp. JY17]|uniref:GatB/YqeY domain-containing protein n=1 Tax=Halobacteriovorax sp. JY17 TaxID=2014617 RepID=UPI000C444FAE|nr:GatB/YqeY domain-containing protein [Halobacteriovorax sp. JY17]PIK13643.1 MAG: glutamyl-tRNA amidotransferase [Halobacteriovorax sp. JY17]